MTTAHTGRVTGRPYDYRYPTIDELDPPARDVGSLQVRRAIHLSLARDDIRRARAFFNQAREDVQLNSDQVDYVIDCAHDCQRDARRHLEAAVRS